MSVDKQAPITEKFQAKNARRKANHTPNARSAREARRLAGGCFGSLKPEQFNTLAQGTSGIR